jgi:hypothetical protein
VYDEWRERRGREGDDQAIATAAMTRRTLRATPPTTDDLPAPLVPFCPDCCALLGEADEEEPLERLLEPDVEALLGAEVEDTANWSPTLSTKPVPVAPATVAVVCQGREVLSWVSMSAGRSE